MPHGSHLSPPSVAPPQPLTSYEHGRDLCTFVSTAASHVMRTLQRPCRSRPSKRKVNHRRFLQNQICRSFSDIEAATRRLASSILSQEAQPPPTALQEMNPAKPSNPAPARAPPGSFLGTAEAFVAPDPSPCWTLSLDALMAGPDELFEPITEEKEPASSILSLCSPDPLGSFRLGWDAPPGFQSHGEGSAVYGTCAASDVCLPGASESPIPASSPGALVVPDQDNWVPIWDLEMW